MAETSPAFSADADIDAMRAVTPDELVSAPAAETEIPALRDALARHASFRPLGLDALEQLARAGCVDACAAHRILFAQGDPGDFAYLILEGAVCVSVLTPHGRATVATLGPGDLVGEIGAFGDAPRTACVATLAPSRMLRLEASAIRDVIARRPETAMAVIQELGRRIQATNGVIATLTQATEALAAGAFQPEMLATLRAQADRFTHFADTFEALAVEISEKRIRAQDMAIAAEIQQALLPRDLSRVSARSAGRADLAAAMIPAKQVGGDYYDAFYVDDHQLALVVGDVAGKGVPAALYMGVACTILRTIARGMATEGPAQTLAQLNRQMARDQHEDMFLTVVYALLDLRDGVVRAACAGHDGAYVLSHGVAPAPLAPTGPAIGLIPGAAYREIRLRLLPGDALLLATDGAWEAFDRSGAVFGETRFEAKLAALSNGLDARGAPPAEALVSGVIDSVAAFADGAPSSDDLTCAAAIWRGPASARA